jgi:hypothetical protein
MKLTIRRVLLGSSLAILTAVAAGCSSPELSDSGPVQSTAPESAPPPPAAPPQAAAVDPQAAPSGDTGLLGGPPRGDQPPVVVASTPVPNPEDLPREERERIYGPDRHPHHAGVVGGRQVARSTHVLRSAHGHRLHGRTAHRAVVSHGPHKIAHGPARALSLHPRAAAPYSAAAPKTHAAPAVAAQVSKLAPATPQTRLTQFAAALGPDLAAAKLNVPASVVAGKPGVVSLTLPSTFLDRIRAEAARHSLTQEAQTTDIRAMLGGAGSAVVPNGVQSARLKLGEAASFNWQVTPSSQTPGPLTAEVSAALKGGATAETVPLGQVTSPSTAIGGPASKASDGAPDSTSDKAAAGNGASPQTGLFILVSLGLVVLALVLAMSARVRKERRLAEQRRKARALEEVEAEHAFHHAPDEPAPEPV